MAHSRLPALAASLLAVLTIPAAAAGLEAYLWKSRPVVLFAPTRDVPAAAEQIMRLAAARAELTERDMPVLVVTTSDVASLSGGRPPAPLDAAALRKAYAVGKDQFAIVLVGKDGGKKLRSTKPVDVRELTALVDAMPMRAREAR